MRYARLVGIAALALSGTAAVGAHHGWTGYDDSTPITVTGTSRESTYENPHGTMRLQAAATVDASGSLCSGRRRACRAAGSQRRR